MQDYMALATSLEIHRILD